MVAIFLRCNLCTDFEYYARDGTPRFLDSRQVFCWEGFSTRCFFAPSVFCHFFRGISEPIIYVAAADLLVIREDG
jgi:hypothetical protein